MIFVTQETATLYSGVGLPDKDSLLLVSAAVALSRTGSLYTEFSIPDSGVLAIKKAFFLTEEGLSPQHSQNLLPHR